MTRYAVSMEIRCQKCGKPITYQGRGRPPTKFCSRKCKEDFRSASQHAAMLGRRAQQRCLQCGEPVPLDAGSRVLTCSEKCSDAWQNAKKRDVKRVTRRAEERNCTTCGQPIPVPDSGRLRAKYCSDDCKKREMGRRWRERSPGYMRQYTYGLTPEQYDTLLAAQDGRCAICGSPDWPGGRKTGSPHVDHGHGTNVVRGLLCGNCNTGLGYFGDDPARLRAAADYLERARVTANG